MAGQSGVKNQGLGKWERNTQDGEHVSRKVRYMEEILCIHIIYELNTYSKI